MTMDEIAVALQKNEDRSKSNTHRIETLEKKYDGLSGIVEAVGRLDEKVDIYNNNTNEKVNVLIGEMKSEVATLTNEFKEHNGKSGKRWESVVERVLLTVVSAIVLYILAKLGF